MPNRTRQKRNPFLVLLLRRMLEYEFEGLGNAPNANKLKMFVFNRHYSRPADKEGREVKRREATEKSDRIYESFLYTKSFDFSDFILNEVVKEVSEMDSFRSWSDFEEKFYNHPGAIIGRMKYMKSDTVLTDQELQKLKSIVNTALNDIHKEKELMGRGESSTLIYQAKDEVIRTANVSEINEIETLAHVLYPCPINEAPIKVTWHKKNPRIFYIYKDHYSTYANINLLPITKDCFLRLKSGEMYESEITDNDIHTIEERMKVQYIYVEGLACPLKKILFAFVAHLDKMIDSLANSGSSKLTICGIGGSKEGDALMLRKGFIQTGWARPPGKDDRYPFFEIQWSSLKRKLSELDDVCTKIASEKRLTRFGGDVDQ